MTSKGKGRGVKEYLQPLKQWVAIMEEVNEQDTKNAIRAFIEDLNEEKRSDFRFLGYGKKKHRYTQKQKDFALNLAQESGVRATAKVLGLHRKTIQRWLRAEGIWVRRCPAWVYDWAYWRRKRNEKWARIRAYRGY